ncbi:hypothetical protein [Streptomyces sp. NPDC050560]|uniref:hypothetical protein n=1 Tax=Streptomyces sp. NPDC050560 TaxID=3365630 RepID=UPI0037911F61
MAAPAHLLLPSASKREAEHASDCTDAAAPGTAPRAREPRFAFTPACDPALRALHHASYGAEPTATEPPLTSEPPLADAAPLTSEPPLADTAPLTSETTATGMAADSDPSVA